MNGYPNLFAQLPMSRKKYNDTYLFEAAALIPYDKVIVTTDARLQSHFETVDWCRLVLLNTFLSQYKNQNI
jgi:hypothetical protein